MPFSRREFIQSASSGIALTWSGLSITAGIAGAAKAWAGMPAGDSQDRPGSVPPRRFLYGTQFYRPPSPERALRREMIKTIAEEDKFNLIRIWPNWDYV